MSPLDTKTVPKETVFDTPLAFARKGGPGRPGQGLRCSSAK